jgi:hypothetical protein
MFLVLNDYVLFFAVLLLCVILISDHLTFLFEPRILLCLAILAILSLSLYQTHNGLCLLVLALFVNILSASLIKNRVHL